MKLKSVFIKVIAILSLVFYTNNLNAQRRIVVQNKVNSYSYDPWHNWMYDNLWKCEKATVYADSLYKIKLLDAEKTDVETVYYKYTSYYLNGKVHRYVNNDWRGDSLILEKSFNPDGVLLCLKFKKDGKCNEFQWQIDRKGNRCLILQNTWDREKQIFETYNIDFESISLKLKNDSLITYKYSQPYSYHIKKTNSEILFKYPRNQTQNLKISLYKSDLNIKSELENIDSLNSYTNLNSLEIWVYDSIYLPIFLEKINAVSSLKNLKEIIIYVKNLKEVPTVIYNCKNLEILKIVGSDIKSISKDIGNLVNLKILHLPFLDPTTISTLIKSISKIPQLYELELPFDLRNPLPIHLMSLTSVKKINFGTCIRSTNPDWKDSFKRDEHEKWDWFYGASDSEWKIYKKNMNFIAKLHDKYKMQFISLNCIRFEDKFHREFALKNPTLLYDPVQCVCFPAGTLVTKSDGSQVAIENIQIGDLLLAYNDTLKRMNTAKVNKHFIHDVVNPELFEIQYKRKDNTIGQISATGNHPFYAAGKWVNASELKVNDKLLYNVGNELIDATITGITKKTSSENKVYNLNTTTHTYIANGVVVHNK